MLSQFTVKNYKSFRDEMTLDMQAVAISEHTDSVLRAENGELMLPVSVIYGPNGGGKSNMLEALYAFCDRVLGPLYAAGSDVGNWGRIRNLDIVPFVFDPKFVEEATEFELFFQTKKAEYRYRLHVLKNRVLFESLDMRRVETNRITQIFERKDGTIIIGDILKRIKVSEDISDTLPLFSYLGITYRKNEIIGDCIQWFEDGIRFLNYGNPAQELMLAINQSVDVKTLILKMIREMDLDIEDFRVERREGGDIQVFTKHKIEDVYYEITLAEESSGTRKLFSLLPFIAESLMKGTVLVIDELDAKIHPVLLKYIIKMYTDNTINRHGAQLIFTSHDLSTLNSSIFRRDEIWFVAKGKEQNSKLYSLVEFKTSDGSGVRKDAKYDKQYLEGRYGADPYLRRIIDWSVI